MTSIRPHLPAITLEIRYPQAPRLWTQVGNMAFLFATAYAIAVVMFRLPTTWFDNGHAFRTALALHVELAVFYWLMSTLSALWSSAAPRPTPIGSLFASFGAAGTIITAVSSVAGGTPLMADYFPWLSGNWVFATGFLVFCAGLIGSACLATFHWAMGHEQSAWRGVGISALPALSAVASAATTIACGGQSLQEVAWAAGHTLLFAHAATLVWEMPRLVVSPSTSNNRPSLLLALVSAVLPLIPLVAPPGTTMFYTAYTHSMTWFLWPPIAAVAAWLCLRRRQRNPDVPHYSELALGIAIALLAVGLLFGACIDGATTLVTAHYHAAVGAVVITRMATTYRWAAQLAEVRVSASRATRQIGTYALGLAFLSGGLALASLDHAPRKTSATETTHKGAYFRSGMIISGVGGLFAMAGSLWLVINLTGGRRSRIPADSPILAQEVGAKTGDRQARGGQQPGNSPVVVE